MHIDPHRRLANRTREKSITVFHGVMERARKLYRLPANPVADIEKPRFPGSAIRVRASWTNGHLTSPKSGRVRSVPMAPQVAEALARFSQRELLIDDDDVVFAGVTGGYLDGSALSKRYRAALQRAALRPLRFHDLRHTFGTRVIGVADIRRVQEWMGHANVQTTMQYLHYVPRRKTPRSSMRRSQRILHAVTTRLNRHSMPLVRAVSSESAFGCSCRFSRTTAPSAREPRPAPGPNG
jgi:integrase